MLNVERFCIRIIIIIASALRIIFIIIVTVVVPRVCVCVSVGSFLPPRASRLRNIGTCVSP